MEKTNNKNLLKLIGIILTINIILSLILTFTVDGNSSPIVRFVDNLFIIGAGSLVLSLVFGTVKFFLRKETFNMLYKGFSITGFVCFLATIIIASFI